MLGDAYFQLRAQIGTGLFSLLRLAAEAEARESTQATLQAMQARLRESFFFAALGPEGSGKSTLLNTLFAREFCGAAEPATRGQVAIFQYADEEGESLVGPGVVECRRHDIFLRDFTILEAAGGTGAETLAPFLARADLIFYVISAAAGPPDAWAFLTRLGRDALKRLVFVVWQSDRVSAEEGANVVKRLRQAMLKNLGQACPIFTGSTADRAGREKLERWIESEVIFAEPRRERLREIGEAVREALREIVARPRAEGKAVEREVALVRRQREDLAECEEQAKRQVAGALWALAQSFEGLRLRGEHLLRSYAGPLELLWKRAVRAEDFAHEIEIQAQASLSVQLHDQLAVLETDLRQSVAEYFRGPREEPAAAPAGQPEFSAARLEEELIALDQPLDLARVVQADFVAASRLLRLPVFAAVGALAAACGVALAGRPSHLLGVLAGSTVLFVLLLAFLLRRNLVASFGRHFTANRAALLTTLEPPWQAAVARFYAALTPALETEAGRLAGEQSRHEPLLVRLREIEQTFSRLEAALRSGLRGAETGEPGR